MAIGMLVVPTVKRSTNVLVPGMSQPARTPAAMAAKIQRVR
jgi:hypothetical protein